METLETSSLTEKVAQKFYCHVCHYSTSRKSNYNKHLLTRKHQKSSNGNTGNTILKKVAEQNPIYINENKKTLQNIKTSHISREKSSKKVAIKHNCCWCNKYYKSRSGCYKHESKCKDKVFELEKKLNNLEKNVGNNEKQLTQNNTINNNITIQLFLDKNCGNAIPIDNFVKNLQISMEDLFNSNKIGYVDGLSSIIVKNLQELEFTKRPIHCSDPKHFKFYVKSEKEWKKDNGDIVGKAVENVKKEATTAVADYMKTNPNNENELLEIMKILQTINKVPSDLVERNKIIKNIGDSVIINNS
jgi:hypothetical protein|tara:strand:- start:43 stop:948 length:906 start_codon:yes stop_codon:yes gene_type:complete